MILQLPNSVKAYFNASNDEQLDSFLEAFKEDAHVFDFKREFNGLEAIRNWCKSDILGVHVRFDIIDAWEQDGAFAVIASLDGEFDKTNLPDPLLLIHTFKLSDGKIQELHVSMP